MKKYNITLPNDVVLYMQRLHMENVAMSNILSNIFMGQIESTNERYEKFLNDYKNNSFEYIMAKEAITNTFVPEKLKSHDTSWYINFETNCLEVTQHCDCEVEFDEKVQTIL